MRTLENILVTGGAGFIGWNFIHYLFGVAGFDGRVANVDSLTSAGNPDILRHSRKLMYWAHSRCLRGATLGRGAMMSFSTT